MLKRENLMKNFLRVRQMAEQNLGRSEKTEALTENLATIEKRIDLIKQVSTSTSKKLSSCLQAPVSDHVEKRLKKLPWTALSHSMIESGNLLGDSLIGKLFETCGELEGTLGREQLQFELDLEKSVLNPLHNIAENDIPNILKLKKQLNKHILDMDSARSRYNQAVRSTQAGSGPNKADVIQVELEDASMKVEQTRDALATEMFMFHSKEVDYSKILLELVQAQVRFHRQSLAELEKILPLVQKEIDVYPHKPVYGQPLEEHLRVTEREISMVIEECVCTLLDIGLEEEGLFRVGGGACKIKKLKAAFDANIVDMNDFARDPHTIASSLKTYLRELPEPLMTYHLYDEWMEAAQFDGPPDQRLQALWVVADKLPRCNYNNLRYLVKFFAKLAENSDVNKMTPSNIAIVIGPNLIWAPGDVGPNVLTTGVHSTILESFITHADWFFPGDIEFSSLPASSLTQSYAGSSPSIHASSPPQLMSASYSATSGSSQINSSLAPTVQRSPSDGGQDRQGRGHLRSPSDGAKISHVRAASDGGQNSDSGRISPPGISSKSAARRTTKRSAPAPPGPGAQITPEKPDNLLINFNDQQKSTLPSPTGQQPPVPPRPNSLTEGEKPERPPKPMGGTLERRATTRPRPGPPPPPPPSNKGDGALKEETHL